MAKYDLNITINRAKLENICQEIWTRCLKPVDQVLEYAALTKQVIDEIVIVGGSSQIPKVQNLLTEYFDGKSLNKSLNPDEAVAYGATILATFSPSVRQQLFTSNRRYFIDLPISTSA